MEAWWRSSSAKPFTVATSSRAKPAEGPTGVDLYVFVKKLSRINARPETAFTPGQAEKLSDLLEPLFERPELDPRAVPEDRAIEHPHRDFGLQLDPALVAARNRLLELLIDAVFAGNQVGKASASWTRTQPWLRWRSGSAKSSLKGVSCM